jgi:hypothetical protein
MGEEMKGMTAFKVRKGRENGTTSRYPRKAFRRAEYRYR